MAQPIVGLVVIFSLFAISFGWPIFYHMKAPSEEQRFQLFHPVQQQDPGSGFMPLRLKKMDWSNSGDTNALRLHDIMERMNIKKNQ